MFTAHRRRHPPRVLYLAFYFPPSRASGVYRARATANHLAERGWDVTVCASPVAYLHKVTGTVDEELLGTVDPRIRIERPAMTSYALNKDLRTFGRLRRNWPETVHRLHQWSQRRLFPENYSPWALAAVARGLALHTRRRYDVVLATGNPFASFAAAWLFHRATGVPYVVDYRDSWTLNLFTEELAQAEGHPSHRWERRILRSASASVFVNEALRGWHARRHPDAADRMLVVPNGWDPDVLTDAPQHRTGHDRPLRFTYLGTITGVQPVEQMVDAFRRLRSHAGFDSAELHVHGHLGFFRQGQEAARQRLLGPEGGPDNGVRYRGPVSKTEVAGVYEDSDVLVFLAAGARYVTSGKVFEYMAAGRPIVSVHAPGIAARDVLDGYPLWFNADSLDPSAVADAMVAAAKAARDLTPAERQAAREYARRYTREATLAPLEARLRELAEAS
ncbi:glycosyltransferase [Streptomyces sp. NPDC050095]|uniref:glycosyltransferase n=1 Tax=unclassified Streptomyces TaxID=2593676 RepID=UPI003423C33E